jgi:hypothetical protein
MFTAAAGSADAEDAKALPNTGEVNRACCEVSLEAALKIDMVVGSFGSYTYKLISILNFLQ